MTLRELDDELPGAYWSTWEDANNSESYGFLSDLVRDLDDRVDYDESGKLPSKADLNFYIAKRGEGEFLLFEDYMDKLPFLVVLTPEAFSKKFPELA